MSRLRASWARLSPAMWSLTSRMVATLSFAAVNILLARRLTTADFGVFAVVTSVATFGGFVVSAGVNRTLLRNVAGSLAVDRVDEVRGDLHVGGRILVSSAPLGVLLTVGVTFLLLRGDHRALGLALTAGALALGLGLVLVLSDVLRGFGEIRLANLTAGRSGGALALTILALALVVASGRLTLLEALWFTVLGLVVPVVALALMFRRVAPRAVEPVVVPEPWARRALLVASVVFAGTQIAAFLSTQVDLWVGSVELSSSDLGVYAVALRLMNVVAVPLFAAQLVVIARVSALHARGRRRELEGMVRRTATMVTVPALVLLLPCILLPSQVLELLFGPRYARGGEVLAILAIAQLVNVVTGLCGTVLAMTSHERLVLWVTAGGAAISALADIVGARAGLVGLAIASATTTSAMFLALWLLCRVRTGMWTHPGWSDPVADALADAPVPALQEAPG